MQITAKEYARKHGISLSAARSRLEKLVAVGAATKATYDEMVYRRQRGYSGKLMPTKITTYTIL